MARHLEHCHLPCFGQVTLDLAETEVIFPTGALTMLCFVWAPRKNSITHTSGLAPAKQSSHSTSAASATLSPHQQAGGGQDLGRGHHTQDC